MSLRPVRRGGEPTQAAEGAAAWALAQEDGPLSPRDQQDFETWLAANPEHVDAYEAAVWALCAASRHAGAAELMSMREDALAARGQRRPRPVIWTAIAGAMAASIAGLWLFMARPGDAPQAPHTPNQVAAQGADPATATYSTAVGERLAVTLPDGSVATLDTNSRLRVAYNVSERGIHLLQGQALFEVAPGRPLPFKVHAGGQDIVAVGTVFNVRLDGNRVRVALVEGVVHVRPTAPAAARPQAAQAPPVREVTMRAGEMLEFRPDQPVLVRPAQVAQIASWRGGELVFNDMRLADAVAEINRYTDKPIQIADPAVGEHRVTGVFRSNDTERFSRAMGEVFPIEVAHGRDGSPILRERH